MACLMDVDMTACQLCLWVLLSTLPDPSIIVTVLGDHVVQQKRLRAATTVPKASTFVTCQSMSVVIVFIVTTIFRRMS
jgi:hypothetical protein